MIELPVSTCEMVVAPKKKRRIFKEKLIKKVNKKAEARQETEQAPVESQTEFSSPSEQTEEIDLKPSVIIEKSDKKSGEQKRRFKFDLIAAEVIAIFVLVVAILLTNIFWEDSGINTMIKSVFGTKTETAVDTRTAKDLAVSSPSASSMVTTDEGVMTFCGKAAVYPPASGKVVSVVKNENGYTLEIAHSDVFMTIISGADAVYVKEGDGVYVNIPVAYAKEGTAVAMYDGDTLVKDYVLDNGKIVWQS